MTAISSTVLAGQLVRLQMGQEAAWGTKHAATALLMGAVNGVKITPATKDTIFPHQLGTLEPAFVHAKLQSGGTFSIPGTLTYEEAMILLGWALGTVSPTTGASSTVTSFSGNGTVVTLTCSGGLITTPGEYVTVAGATAMTGGTINGTQLVTGGNGTTTCTFNNTTTVATITSCTVLTPYQWSNSAALASVPNVLPYTLELGNMGDGANLDDVLLTGCLPQTLKISGEIGKEMTFQVDGFGQQFNTGVNLTGAIGYKNPIPEPALFLGSSFYMDPLGTAAGTTAFANTCAKYDLEITTGMVPVFTAGSLTPTAWTHKAIDTKLTLTFILNNTLRTFLTTNLLRDSQVGNQVGATIRLKCVSQAKVMQLDFAGIMDTDPALFDANQEAQAVSVSMSAMYDSTMGNHLKSYVANAVTVLP